MKIKYILSAILCFCSLISSAQEEKDSIALPTDVLKVTQTNILDIQSFDVLDIPVEDEKNVQDKLPINVQILALDYEFPDLPLTIKPLRYQHHREPNYNDGWLKIGFGSPNQVLSDLGYYYSIENWYGLGADVRYHSARDKTRYQANFRDIETNLKGHYFLNKKTKAVGGIQYQYQQVGLRDESLEALDTLSAPLLNQSNNQFAAFVGLHGTPYQSLRLLYGIQANYAINFIPQESYNEHNTHTSAYLKKHFSKAWGVNIDADFHHTRATLDQEKTNINAVNLKPFVQWSNPLLTVHAGVNFMDKQLDKIYPYTFIKYAFSNQKAWLSIGTNSYQKTNNFHSNKQRIPEVLPSIEWLQAQEERQIYLEAALNKNNTSQQLRLSYNQHINDVNFFYDAKAARLIGKSINYSDLKAELRHSMDVNHWFSYHLQLIQRMFLEAQAEDLALLPSTFFKGTLQQSLLNAKKLVIKQTVFYVKRNEIIHSDNTIFPDDIIDLNLEINYKFNDKLSGFIQGFNLLNKAYIQWENYTSFGMQSMAGIQFVF